MNDGNKNEKIQLMNLSEYEIFKNFFLCLFKIIYNFKNILI